MATAHTPTAAAVTAATARRHSSPLKLTPTASTTPVNPSTRASSMKVRSRLSVHRRLSAIHPASPIQPTREMVMALVPRALGSSAKTNASASVHHSITKASPRAMSAYAPPSSAAERRPRANNAARHHAGQARLSVLVASMRTRERGREPAAEDGDRRLGRRGLGGPEPCGRGALPAGPDRGGARPVLREPADPGRRRPADGCGAGGQARRGRGR